MEKFLKLVKPAALLQQNSWNDPSFEYRVFFLADTENQVHTFTQKSVAPHFILEPKMSNNQWLLLINLWTMYVRMCV